MVSWVFAFILVSLPLIIGEILNLYFKNSPEIIRKIVHICASISSALLVLLLSIDEIAVLAVIYFFILLIIRRRKLAKSLYGVKRHTYGELFFPLGVFASALIAGDTSIYVISMLLLGFSDSAASIIGQRVNSKKYTVFASSKSVAGSIAFLSITALILGVSNQFGLTSVIILSVLLTAVEASSPYGVDNLTIPLVFCVIVGVN